MPAFFPRWLPRWLSLRDRLKPAAMSGWLVLVGWQVGCDVQQAVPSAETSLDAVSASPAPPPRSLADRFGTQWQDDLQRFQKPPLLSEVRLPEVYSADAVWGSLGRDQQGNVYVGVSCNGSGALSAALLKIPDNSHQAVHLGDALQNLRRLGLASQGTSQMKIHSKPVQAADGYVYFTSMDERGEREDGSMLPTWGSHLWRIEPGGSAWQHMQAFEQGLIATGSTGRYVYALGYFNHVLYQFDTQDHSLRRRTLGSVGGHISRNFLIDANEHAYAPRVQETGNDQYQVELVELNPSLQEVTAHPLEHYPVTPGFGSHGIVSFAALDDGDLVFTTSTGALYRLHPDAEAGSTLEHLGPIHPAGESYTAVLTCPTGNDLLCGLGRVNGNGSYDYLTYDLTTGTSQVLMLEPTSVDLLGGNRMYLFGCNTLDNAGNAFAVGRDRSAEGLRPVVLRMQW